jgi:hypothetical protein
VSTGPDRTQWCARRPRQPNSSAPDSKQKRLPRPEPFMRKTGGPAWQLPNRAPFSQLSSRPDPSPKVPVHAWGMHAMLAMNACSKHAARAPSPAGQTPPPSWGRPMYVRAGVVTCPPARRAFYSSRRAGTRKFSPARAACMPCRYQMHCMHGPAVDPWTRRGERETDGVGHKRLVALRLAESRGGGR